MKLEFDRTRSVFPTRIRLGDILNTQFAPVIVYEIDEPTQVFFGASVRGEDTLIWEATLVSPDAYPYASEFSLSLSEPVKMADFIRGLGAYKPAGSDVLEYQWLLGYKTADMTGEVTDSWDAATIIEGGEFNLGLIALAVGIVGILVGVALTGGR